MCVLAGLAIVINRDGSFVKHSILVKWVYISVRNAPGYVEQQCQFERIAQILGCFGKLKDKILINWTRYKQLNLLAACELILAAAAGR